MRLWRQDWPNYGILEDTLPAPGRRAQRLTLILLTAMLSLRLPVGPSPSLHSQVKIDDTFPITDFGRITAMNYDFHIHTVLCGHAEPAMTVSNIIARAEEISLEAIAITEHVSGIEDMKNIDILCSEMQRHHGSCQVIIGAEVDVDRRHLDGRLVLDKRLGLDYVIGSMHYLPGTDVLPHCDLTRPISPEETFIRWRSTLLGLVS